MDREKMAQDIINTIPEGLDYYVYRRLWEKFIKEDCLSIIEEQYADNDYIQERADEIAEKAAHKYCYEGEYDCSIPFWDNLTEIVRGLVEDYLS